MKLSLKNVGAALTEASINGATLWGAEQGFYILDSITANLTARTPIPPTLRTMGLAVGVTLFAEGVLPVRARKLVSAYAMKAVIDTTIGEKLDPIVEKLAAIGAPAASGAQGLMGGYAKMGKLMGGYSKMGGLSTMMGRDLLGLHTQPVM